jgi:hypothetical protein
MKKNIEKLAEYGETRIKEDLLKSVRSIENDLESVNDEVEQQSRETNKRYLKQDVIQYLALTKSYKEEYGVEFPEIEAQYDKLKSQVDNLISNF